MTQRQSPPKKTGKKRPYQKPKVEVVELSTEQSLLAVCLSSPASCQQPFTRSLVPAIRIPKAEDER